MAAAASAAEWWWWVGRGEGRTMAASMACLRSSSTVCRVESFSSCVIFAAIIGTWWQVAGGGLVSKGGEQQLSGSRRYATVSGSRRLAVSGEWWAVHSE